MFNLKSASKFVVKTVRARARNGPQRVVAAAARRTLMHVRTQPDVLISKQTSLVKVPSSM